MKEVICTLQALRCPDCPFINRGNVAPVFCSRGVSNTPHPDTLIYKEFSNDPQPPPASKRKKSRS